MNKIVFRLYQIILLLMLLWGAKAWFTWPWDSGRVTVIMYLFFIIFSLLYKIRFKIRIRISKKKLLGFGLLILGILLMQFNIIGFIQKIMQVVPLLIIVNDNKYNKEHLQFVSKAFGYIIIIGVVLFLLMKIGISFIPSIPIAYDNENFISYVFQNYFFFIKNSWSDGESLRFQSLFLEPGYLGTVSAFLLFLNNFDFKKRYNVFILLGLLFSFSLAGYIIGVIAYILHLIENRRKIVKPILFLVLLIATYNTASLVNNGNNLLNELIFSRLQNDKEKGIVGNNRFHGDTDAIFEYSVLNGKVWFGLSKDELKIYDISGAGFKIFILYYGIIPLSLIMGFYFSLAFSNGNNKHLLFACVLLLMIFIQATTPLSYRWLVSFCLAVPICPTNSRSR